MPCLSSEFLFTIKTLTSDGNQKDGKDRPMSVVRWRSTAAARLRANTTIIAAAVVITRSRAFGCILIFIIPGRCFLVFTGDEVEREVEIEYATRSRVQRSLRWSPESSEEKYFNSTKSRISWFDFIEHSHSSPIECEKSRADNALTCVMTDLPNSRDRREADFNCTSTNQLKGKLS